MIMQYYLEDKYFLLLVNTIINEIYVVLGHGYCNIGITLMNESF